MMKKIILPVVLLVTCPLTFSAALPQSDEQEISIKDTEVMRIDNSTVRVSFRIELGDRVTAPSRSLVIVPSIRGLDGQQSELPPIIVRGERAKAEVEAQVMNAAGIELRGRQLTSNGKTLDYRTSIPWQEWMEGSQLILTGYNTGRDRSTEVEIGMVADGLMLGQGTPVSDYAATPPDVPSVQMQRMETAHETQVRQRTIATIGDELAARFTFVEPVAKFNQAYRGSSIDEVFDYNMPLIFGTGTTQQDDEVGRFIEMTREGALYVKFERGDQTVNRDLGENNQRLVDLISSIRVLDTSAETRIAQVIVVGFSAPEGALDEKETLALERAGVIRDFLTANSRIDPAIISTYNGSVDWRTLRILVSESNMPEKYKVLDIIDNVPAWGNARSKGRLAQLMALNDGEEFRYMRELFFPQLRQTGAYIKVYYENVR